MAKLSSPFRIKRAVSSAYCRGETPPLMGWWANPFKGPDSLAEFNISTKASPTKLNRRGDSQPFVGLKNIIFFIYVNTHLTTTFLVHSIQTTLKSFLCRTSTTKHQRMFSYAFFKIKLYDNTRFPSYFKIMQNFMQDNHPIRDISHLYGENIFMCIQIDNIVVKIFVIILKITLMR